MFERISDAIKLFCLRAGEWVADLSPIGKTMLLAAFVALVAAAVHFGFLPSRRQTVGCDYCR